MIRVNPFPLVTVLLAAAFVVSACTRDSETSSGVVTNGGPICGDGIVNSAVEQCDDGNGDDTDTCSNSCLTQERVDGPVTSPSRSQDYHDCIASGADVAECEEL